MTIAWKTSDDIRPDGLLVLSSRRGYQYWMFAVREELFCNGLTFFKNNNGPDNCRQHIGICLIGAMLLLFSVSECTSNFKFEAEFSASPGVCNINSFIWLFIYLMRFIVIISHSVVSDPWPLQGSVLSMPLWFCLLQIFHGHLSDIFIL